MEKSVKIFTILIAVVFGGLPIVAQAQQNITAKISTVDEAGEYVRSFQFQRDFEMGTIEGERLIKKYPESVELRAWYLANMARNDMAEEAVNKAEKLAVECMMRSDGYFSRRDR